MPRAQERPANPRGRCACVWLAALVLVSPRSPCVSWPRRLGAPPACTTGVLAADSVGYAARASRAKATLPTDSPRTLSRRVLCTLTKLARRCLLGTLEPEAPARGGKSCARLSTSTYLLQICPRASDSSNDAKSDIRKLWDSKDGYCGWYLGCVYSLRSARVVRPNHSMSSSGTETGEMPNWRAPGGASQKCAAEVD
ncbi:hypothetical protein FB451DRAFT_1249797 [Mycena latifolia]|nr:hypothetical protein FB451DRAFT_1249797 [Mycena latifolia]